MGSELNILIVEDSLTFPHVLLKLLRHEWEVVNYKIAPEKITFLQYLDEFNFDLIILDYTLLDFNALEALKIINTKKIDKPVIVVSGTVGEEIAVETMRYGASDYLMKDNLKRLIPAIKRELNESKIRKDKKQATVNLKLLQEKLEIIVEQRTKQLKDANEALRREIFQRKDAENKNNILEEIFSKIFEVSPISNVLTTTKDSKIVKVNSAFKDIYGYTDDVVGKSIDALGVWKNDQDRLDLKRALLSGEKVRNKETALIGKDGKEITALLSLERVKVKGEDFIITAGIDISERKALEDKLYKALENERELNMLRSQFVSMISHEYRTPLTEIMLSTDLLKRYGDNWNKEEKNKHYQRIQETIQKMIKLMENVFIIGNINSNKFAIQVDEFDLIPFMDSLINNINHNFDDKVKVNIDYDIHENRVLYDENLLSLIVSNVVINAIMYSEKEGEVRVNVIERPGEYHLLVEDDGIGIPDEEKQKVFEPFYRGENTKSVSGYGLGLSIVKKCVNLLDGDIKIHSELNKGTQIEVTLPKKIKKY